MCYTFVCTNTAFHRIIECLELEETINIESNSLFN